MPLQRARLQSRTTESGCVLVVRLAMKQPRIQPRLLSATLQIEVRRSCSLASQAEPCRANDVNRESRLPSRTGFGVWLRTTGGEVSHDEDEHANGSPTDDADRTADYPSEIETVDEPAEATKKNECHSLPKPRARRRQGAPEQEKRYGERCQTNEVERPSRVCVRRRLHRLLQPKAAAGHDDRC